MTDYTDFNSKIIDNWVNEGWIWGTPISHEAYIDAQKGKWDVVLTPLKSVPHDWFAPYLRNEKFEKTTKILGLASAGGQQMPIFKALGADCTVLDYSDKMLENEKIVAVRENYDIKLVKADMAQPFPFSDESFDIIFHPVSNCYVEDIQSIWDECYRVLKKGGLLIAGMDSGFNYLFSDEAFEGKEPLLVKNVLPFNPLKNVEQRSDYDETEDAWQFSHSFEEQIGGQLKAGFQLTAAFDDFYNEEEKKLHGFATFWATRAIKM